MSLDATEAQGLRTGSAGPVARFCGRVARWSAANPRRVLGLCAALLLVGALLLTRVRVDTSLTAMLGEDAPAALAMERVLADYDGTDALLVLVEPEGAARELAAPEAGRGPTPQQQAAMLRFAERFELALRAEPAGAELVTTVRWRPEPAIVQWVTRTMIPAGAYYLGPQGVAELAERLSPAQMDRQLARAEALLAAPGPAGQALAGALAKDPLRLSELAAKRLPAGLTGGASAGPDGAAGPEWSRDGRALLIRVGSRAPFSNTSAAQRLAAAADRAALIAARDIPGVRAAVGGSSAIAATSSRVIRTDSIASVVASVMLLNVLFLLFYGRFSSGLIVGAVAGAGMLVGFGVHALAVPLVSPLAAAVAALLAGLGVDYGIHFLSHYRAARSAGNTPALACEHTATLMGVPIVTNCFTSIFGFASLWPSPIRMLSDFATMGTLGLIGALLAVFTLLPALLVLTDRPRTPLRTRPAPEGPQAHADEAQAQVRDGPAGALASALAGAVARAPRAVMLSTLAVPAALVIAALVAGASLKLEGDLTVLHPRPNPAFETTGRVLERFGGQGELLPVELSAADGAGLVVAAYQLAAALDGLHGESFSITGVLGLHSLLPDPRLAGATRAALASIDPVQVKADFAGAVERSAFGPSAFKGYEEFLTTLVRPGPTPDVSALIASGAGIMLLPREVLAGRAPPTRAVALIVLDRPLHERRQRAVAVAAIQNALTNVPGAQLAGLAAVSTDLERSASEGLPISVGVSVGLVLAWLLLVFRRVTDVAMALIPLAFAAGGVVLFMSLTGLKFNPINSVAIPLLNGIAVDAGVFLVATYKLYAGDRAGLVRALRSTCHAVLLATATTVTGFASLCFTHTPAIQSLGLIAAVGITASMIGALLVLMPLVVLRSRLARPSSGPAPEPGQPEPGQPEPGQPEPGQQAAGPSDAPAAR